MIGFILGRLLRGVVVILVAATAIFFLVRLTGDPAAVYLPLDASADLIASVRSQLGLDQPLVVQYVSFVVGLSHGDFGNSLLYNQSALSVVLARLPLTLQLTVAGLGLSLVIGIPAGIFAALRHGKKSDGAIVTTAVVLQNIPSFWLGIVLVAVFGVSLKWFPVGGADTWSALVLPAVTLGAYSIAAVARLTRSSLIEVMSQSYVRTAQAKGARSARMVLVHELPNAMLPVLSFAGMQFGVLLGGSVVVEAIFNFPGMGQLVIQAVTNRDFALIQAFALVVAALIILTNIVVDLLYRVANPRFRTE